MMEEIVSAFGQYRKVTDFYRLRIAAEDYLSPAEMRELYERRGDLLPEARDWLDQLGRYMFSEVPKVRPYARRRLGDHVWFFGHGPGEARRPHLLLGFCGGMQRLMVPISIVLQHIDAERFDVVVFNDPSRRRFLFGIDGFADTFEGIVARLLDEVDPGAYESVRSVGASNGGYAAMRAGIELGAERVVLLGGRPIRTYRRQIRGQEPVLQAFERVFARAAEVPTRYIAAYSEDNEVDRNGAQALAQRYGAEEAPVSGIEDHNVLFEVLKEGWLARLMDGLLLSDDPLHAVRRG